MIALQRVIADGVHFLEFDSQTHTLTEPLSG